MWPDNPIIGFQSYLTRDGVRWKYCIGILVILKNPAYSEDEFYRNHRQRTTQSSYLKIRSLYGVSKDNPRPTFQEKKWPRYGVSSQWRRYSLFPDDFHPTSCFNHFSSPEEPNHVTENPIKLFSIRRKLVRDVSIEAILILGEGGFEIPRLWIPSSVRGVSVKSLEGCKIIGGLSFEPDSRLIRIGSDAFRYWSLQSIEIPRNVEIHGSSCLSDCESLSSISFESNSRLIWIESSAFSRSSLQLVELPRNAVILGSSYFSYCGLLSFISFEPKSRLNWIESSPFSFSSLRSREIPRRVFQS
jgi:hypothetical protein